MLLVALVRRSICVYIHLYNVPNEVCFKRNLKRFLKENFCNVPLDLGLFMYPKPLFTHHMFLLWGQGIHVVKAWNHNLPCSCILVAVCGLHFQACIVGNRCWSALYSIVMNDINCCTRGCPQKTHLWNTTVMLVCYYHNKYIYWFSGHTLGVVWCCCPFAERKGLVTFNK